MPLYILLDLLAAACLVLGLVLMVSARRYRTADAPPMLTWNPRHWKPVWATRDWFETATGFRYYVLGAVLCSCGGLMLIIVLLVH